MIFASGHLVVEEPAFVVRHERPVPVIVGPLDRIGHPLRADSLTKREI